MEALPPQPPEADGPPTVPEPAAGEPQRRPRGRTPLIIASAALLGIVAGVATGYTVQAERPPTPLPPLSQAALSYPDEHLPAGKHQPGPHDRALKTDGDLRKLLIEKPKGARTPLADPSPDGWVPLSTYVREYEHPDAVFRDFASWDIRRVAGADWETGRYREVSIRLVQFHDHLEANARVHAAGQQTYMSGEEYAGANGHPLRGPGDGLYWVDEAPRRTPGYLPAYDNRAIASRGDIMMDIQVYDVRPVDEEDIRELAERQWGRL